MLTRIAFKTVQRELSSRYHQYFTTVVQLSHGSVSNDKVVGKKLNFSCDSIRRLSTQSREMVKAKKYIVAKHFVNSPLPTDLKLVEEELPALKNGEYLVQAEYLSVDPYMRPYMLRYPVGSTMIGSQIAKIVESKNPEYPVGKRIVAYLGWRTHTIINPNASDKNEMNQNAYILPDLGDLSPSLGLGILGMPGNTAYFGLLEICKPKPGETLVISGAAGAVGSHVGQIGKNMGLKVIGICGSDEKCKWLTEELGFDFVINYKTMPVVESLRKAAPEGVDCYFDNVGGDISGAVMYQMRLFGRIAVCGSISSYNADVSSLPQCAILQPTIVFNQLKIEGFIVSRWNDRWLEGIQQNLKWIREGKLIYRETITKGFENMFDAFMGMMRGQNIGKAVVQV